MVGTFSATCTITGYPFFIQTGTTKKKKIADTLHLSVLLHHLTLYRFLAKIYLPFFNFSLIFIAITIKCSTIGPMSRSYSTIVPVSVKFAFVPIARLIKQKSDNVT